MACRRLTGIVVCVAFTLLPVACVGGPAVGGSLGGAATTAMGAGSGSANASPGSGGAGGSADAANAAAGSIGATPATSPANLWSFLCPTPQQKAECKQKICNSAIGKLLNAILMPVSAMSGGLLGPFCPGPNNPNPADLAKPADSAQGAAARIKQEEADARARAAAVRYLATVDCRYYPEAEAALINSLRADTSECVRIEAAKAFANGCCCNRRTMAALLLVVNESDADGNPIESSECVKALSFIALKKCLASHNERVRQERPETPKGTSKDGKALHNPKKDKAAAMLPEYYTVIANDTSPELVNAVQKAIDRGMNISRETLMQLGGTPDLATAWAHSRAASNPKQLESTPEPPIVPVSTSESPAWANAPERKPKNLLQLWRNTAQSSR